MFTRGFRVFRRIGFRSLLTIPALSIPDGYEVKNIEVKYVEPERMKKIPKVVEVHYIKKEKEITLVDVFADFLALCCLWYILAMIWVYRRGQ